eukprot:TRINITY_DN1590_c0_g1_i1.p1 TRINITY_DN1590_c0_g1~~TRINITY_DN1590_c0_g1_i1.p1  ORF type:complete len:146 (+),score=24.44 TRINITY_DN1590_c0_g1_i1:138-575(+)
MAQESLLQQLEKVSFIEADAVNLVAIAQYHPHGATTNMTMICEAIRMPEFDYLVMSAITRSARRVLDEESVLYSLDRDHLFLDNVSDEIVCNLARDILALLPGQVSIPVNPKLAFSARGMISHARKLAAMVDERDRARLYVHRVV